MEKFVSYAIETLLLLFALTPLLMGMIDTMLNFLFDYTLLHWTPNRVMFAIAWTLLPGGLLMSMAGTVLEK